MTVDTWEMVVVHRMFRREFRLLPGLVSGVAGGDTVRAEVVGEFAADLIAGLHHHHTGEDDLLWPLLLDRVGAEQTDLVKRMESQHETVAVLMHRVEDLLPRWRARADAETRDALAVVLKDVSVALDEHLTDEENEVLPLVSRLITQAEWDALGERGKEALPKGRKGFVFLSAILEDASPSERTRFLALLPGPVRAIHRVIGAGLYRRAKARLHAPA